MTHKELDGCTGTWKGKPAVIALDKRSDQFFILQNISDE